MRQFPKSTYILDRMHLRSHLFEGARAVGVLPDKEREWVDRLDNTLGRGEVEAVMEEISQHASELDQRVLDIIEMEDGPERRRLEKTRQLFQARASRLTALHDYIMRFSDGVAYDTYGGRGWPIGSGEIESAHRQIPQPRLKRPGVAFTLQNVDKVLALRTLRANGDWEDYWVSRAA